MTAALSLTREQVLAFRRRSGALDERLPAGPSAARRAAWAGLTDSVPRAALLQLHARVAGTTPASLDDPALVQVWGPRFSTYVVPAEDHVVFTVGRTILDEGRRRWAVELADRLDAVLAGRELDAREAGAALGVHPTMLRYAATTGRVLIRWDGARQPTVRTVPPPEVTAAQARAELARRYLRVLGPGTAEGLGNWAGLRPRAVRAALEALGPELLPVRTDLGDAWALAVDEPDLRGASGPPAPARLLPSGDAYSLLHGRERELLVPDAARRAELWTSRVWPGAVVVGGEVVGTWRRADATVTVRAWGELAPPVREAVEAEAATMPLPGPTAPVAVRWEA